jgi:hypothetical protein
MTRGRGIMGIFHQNELFSKVFVIWGVRVKALVIRWAIWRMTDNLGGAKLYFSQNKVLKIIAFKVLLRTVTRSMY